MRAKVYIIAEAGVNHNGSLARAHDLIDCAVASGADAVKFQSFRTEALVSRSAPMAKYQMDNDPSNETQFEMLKKLELSVNDHFELQKHATEKKIDFLSTPFEIESLKFLVNDLKMKTIKIPSGELTNGPFLLEIAYSAESVILSTGLATLEEINQALKVLAFGFSKANGLPVLSSLNSELTSDDMNLLKERVTILHATTEYPAPVEDINLNAMIDLREKFGLPVGYSDHSLGITIPIAATALNASIIEKHFTLDRSLPGPDHRASLEPRELAEMVSAIRETEKALGDGHKRPMSSEAKNLPIARKSLHAGQDIKKGEAFSIENLAIKRPGSGISPMQYWDYLGRLATRDFERDDLIE